MRAISLLLCFLLLWSPVATSYGEGIVTYQISEKQLQTLEMNLLKLKSHLSEREKQLHQLSEQLKKQGLSLEEQQKDLQGLRKEIASLKIEIENLENLILHLKIQLEKSRQEQQQTQDSLTTALGYSSRLERKISLLRIAIPAAAAAGIVFGMLIGSVKK